MVWCTHCQEDCCTVYDPDKGFVCCTGCGRVLDQDLFSDEPTFIKDGSGQSRLAGTTMKSSEYSYSVSRARTLERGRDEIFNITNHLQISGAETTINGAHRLYEIAVDKNFTRGRRTSHVAAACLYIYCRSKKRPYLLIDFSDYLMTSVYVLGAVFLQLCNTLRLADHAFVQQIIDPSLFIHRFTDRLLGRSNELVTKTALQIVASMKRDWMQTGRKPSGLCGAAIYLSALSHGLNYSKSDVVTVVHVCEATLTKRLIEFENTESGGLTIEEFLTRADDLNQGSAQSQLPRPGEVICEHKNEKPHFACGLCKKCFDQFNDISGGLEGGADPPAFQRAEKLRIERAKAQEKMKESSVTCDKLPMHTSVKETGVSKIDSDSTKYELLASKEYERHKVGDASACIEVQELQKSADDDPENLSDIDDVEVDGYLHNEDEKRLKKIIWEEMNKEYLEEQAAKEAACEVDSNGEPVVKPKKKRKQRSAEEAKNSNPAETPLEATRQMLKKKTFSSRVNYEALESLYTTEQEKAKQQEGKLDVGDANGSDAGAVEDGDETGTFDDGDFEQVGLDPDYVIFGNDDESNPYEELEF